MRRAIVVVATIVEQLHHKKAVPERIRMELVRVTKGNLGDWARQLGFHRDPRRLPRALTRSEGAMPT